jgi:hypothetical protein
MNVLSLSAVDQPKKDKRLMAAAVNGTECKENGFPGSTAKLQWLIQNDSDDKWSKSGCHLRNVREEECRGNAIFLGQRMKPGESVILTVLVKLPEDLLGY